MEPIGYISTRYEQPDETPIQTLRNPGDTGRLVVLPEFVAGLEGLAEFDFAYVLTVFHRFVEDELRQPKGFPPERLRPIPFMLQGGAEHVGVFATRFPVRPNFLGLSLIRIRLVSDNVIEFSGVDFLNGTPVLDIKPWEQQLDLPDFSSRGVTGLNDIRAGWYRRTQTPAGANPLAGRGSLIRAGVLEPRDSKQLEESDHAT